jgi:hypothetical protein
MFEIKKSDSPEPDLNQKVICACIIAWVAKQSLMECKCCAHSHARYHGPGCHLAHSKQVARHSILPEERDKKDALQTLGEIPFAAWLRRRGSLFRKRAHKRELDKFRRKSPSFFRS